MRVDSPTLVVALRGLGKVYKHRTETGLQAQAARQSGLPTSPHTRVQSQSLPSRLLPTFEYDTLPSESHRRREVAGLANRDTSCRASSEAWRMEELWCELTCHRPRLLEAGGGSEGGREGGRERVSGCHVLTMCTRSCICLMKCILCAQVESASESPLVPRSVAGRSGA